MSVKSQLACLWGSLAPFTCHQPSFVWGTVSPGLLQYFWLESSES